MLRINCPLCGPRDHTEFVYEGDATVCYPALDAKPEAWYEAVFLRKNPRGVHLELWHHTQGCRSVLIVERDTVTHEIHSVRLAHPGMAEAAQ
ncbi:MAG: sarcosine oxidase subunit delta [Pikeienuella sp.]